MDRHIGSLEKLLDKAAEDDAVGLGDAPWPPHFRKAAGEGIRVTPSRAKAKRTKMPVIVIANSPDKEAAWAGLTTWKAQHKKVNKYLVPDDFLVDSMRGSSSTWTRVRVNLQHVPEDQRSSQGIPDPDEGPTREYRELPPKAR